MHSKIKGTQNTDKLIELCGNRGKRGTVRRIVAGFVYRVVVPRNRKDKAKKSMGYGIQKMKGQGISPRTLECKL